MKYAVTLEQSRLQTPLLISFRSLVVTYDFYKNKINMTSNIPLRLMPPHRGFTATTTANLR